MPIASKQCPAWKPTTAEQCLDVWDATMLHGRHHHRHNDHVPGTKRVVLFTVEKGYALKKKKTSARYKESAKEFICQLFDEGIRTGTKISPEVAEKRMLSVRNADGSKRYSAEERFNSRQISSFYSRITSDRKENQGASTVCVSSTSVPSTTPYPNGGGTTTKGKGRKCKGKGGRGKRQIEFTEDDEIEDIDEMLVWTAPNFTFFDPSIHDEREFFDPPEID